MKIIELMKKQLDWNMLRWFIVGVTTFAIDYFGFISLYGPIKSVLLANFLSGICSATFNYLAHRYWTFKSDASHVESGAKYALNLLFFWILNTLILKGLITLNISPRIAKVIPVFIVTPFSYFVLNHLVFKKKS